VAEELSPDVQEVPLIAVREAYATVERELRDIVGSEGGVDPSRMGAVSLARHAERLGRIKSGYRPGGRGSERDA
jgi:hypothetical protein